MAKHDFKISCNNITLEYDLYHDRTMSLKEYIINLAHRRRYVSKKKTVLRALDNVTFSLDQGSRLSLIGLNGAGKSTLLKVLAGILQPSEGHLEIVGSVQPLIEIGAGFNPEFSGRENIYLNGYMLGFTKSQIQVHEQEIIDFSELERFIDTPVKYYSSGMMSRLAFTIATNIQPEILLMDEMIGAGDASFIQKAKQRLNRVLDVADMLVLVTHDMSLVRDLTDRTLVLNHGRVVFDGKPEEAIQYYLTEIAHSPPS